MIVFYFFVSSDTLYILYMLFFVCVFICLLFYRYDGHAAIFTFNLNSFHVHVLMCIVLPSSPFFVHCCQIYFLCMLIWAKIK